MRSGVSEGIRISNNKQNKQKRYELTCEPVTSSESFSPSAQHLYDAATWRMYYRIIGARTKRSESGNKTSQAINSALVEHAQTMVRGETPLKSRFATSPTKSLQEFHESQTSFDFPITSRRSRINSVASEASNDVQFRLEFQSDLALFITNICYPWANHWLSVCTYFSRRGYCKNILKKLNQYFTPKVAQERIFACRQYSSAILWTIKITKITAIVNHSFVHLFIMK